MSIVSAIALFIACMVVAFLPGFIGSRYGGRDENAPSQSWYDAYKPSFTPPAMVFPIVWTALYAAIGIALFFAVRSSTQLPPIFFVVFVLNLILNAVWSPLFFRFGQLAWSLVVAVLLVITAAYLVGASAAAGVWPTAGLLAPYTLWLCFAVVLNAAFVVNSRREPEVKWSSMYA